INLRAQTRLKYFAQILLPKADTSFWMLGWSPAATFDVHDVFLNLIQTPNAESKKGQFNPGSYSNPKFDELADKIQVETDTAKRDAMIREATKIYVDDYAYIPLHQQAVIWAARKIVVVVRPANRACGVRGEKVKKGPRNAARRDEAGAVCISIAPGRGSRMIAFLLRRLFQAAIVMLTVALISFV